jgi:2-isopropylmalate synthase
MLEHIKIFDTTLRDGEQSPGASMTLEEKQRIAVTLDDMGVDIIEAGFPRASDGDFAAVKAVAGLVKQAQVAGLARANEADIDAAAKALEGAVKPRIHTFIATSPLHRRYKLNKSQEEVLEAITRSVRYARRFVDDVEWSAEDATRTEPDFLYQAIAAAMAAGASTINIPDTVGYTTPDEFYQCILGIKQNVQGIDDVTISVHCHNDLGLAVANSLAAVRAGARQVECTVNGLGERAGNAAMEEIVMAMRTRKDIYPYTNAIKTEHITKASRLVSAITGFVVQPNKAIVGKNAFAHESGIHQDGMLKNAETYEIMTPESVGLHRSSLVMGKHSGRHAFRTRLQELGYSLLDNELEDAFARFKALADKKKHVYDEDIIALVDDGLGQQNARIGLGTMQVVCGSTNAPAVTLTLTIDGAEQTIQATGDGPVDATFNAIKQLYPHTATLQLFQVHAVTQGTDAQAEVTVRLEEEGRTAHGQGADTDTLVAAAKAYIHALNKLLLKRRRQAVDDAPPATHATLN